MLSFKIKIKKNISSIIWMQLYFYSVFGFLKDVMGFPEFITYFFDIITFGILLLSFLYPKKININVDVKPIKRLIIVFFIVTLITSILNFYSPALYLWGFRNLFRFYICFIYSVNYLQESDCSKMYKFINRLFYLNVIIATLEMFMGYSGDNIGGTFGTASGCNGYLNILLIIITSIKITQYLSKKIKFRELLIVILLCIYFTAIAELKVYFVELLIIIIIAMFNAKFTFRKIVVILGSILAIFVGIQLMGMFFEGSGINFFTLDSLSNYLGDDGYTGTGDLNRFNAIPEIYNRFFVDSPIYSLIGYGLGNCGYSSFDFLTSSFFNMYNWLHYQWFSDAWIFLEMGFIGLIFYELFFVIIFLKCKKIAKYPGITNIQKDICNIGAIVAVLSIFLTVYNVSLSEDSGYFVYIFLSLPFLIKIQVSKISNI